MKRSANPPKSEPVPLSSTQEVVERYREPVRFWVENPDSIKTVKAEALIALRVIGDPDDAPLCRAILRTGDVMARHQAIRVLDYIGGEQDVQAIEHFLAEAPKGQVDALRSLAEKAVWRIRKRCALCKKE